MWEEWSNDALPYSGSKEAVLKYSKFNQCRSFLVLATTGPDGFWVGAAISLSEAAKRFDFSMDANIQIP